MSSDPVESQNGPLVIYIGLQWDGCAYQLGPLSKQRLKSAFPHVRMIPSVFLGYESKHEFEHLHTPLWPEVAIMLSGLKLEQISELGGIRIYDPMAESVIYEGDPAAVTIQ